MHPSTCLARSDSPLGFVGKFFIVTPPLSLFVTPPMPTVSPTIAAPLSIPRPLLREDLLPVRPFPVVLSKEAFSPFFRRFRIPSRDGLFPFFRSERMSKRFCVGFFSAACLKHTFPHREQICRPRCASVQSPLRLCSLSLMSYLPVLFLSL